MMIDNNRVLFITISCRPALFDSGMPLHETRALLLRMYVIIYIVVVRALDRHGFTYCN